MLSRVLPYPCGPVGHEWFLPRVAFCAQMNEHSCTWTSGELRCGLQRTATLRSSEGGAALGAYDS